MFIPLGQIGLGELSEEEKRDFIESLNSDLHAEDAGSVKPMMDGEVRKNNFDLMNVVGNGVDVIQAIIYTAAVAKNAKKLPYFYSKAIKWLEKNDKDSEHIAQVKKMMKFFVVGDESQQRKDKK